MILNRIGIKFIVISIALFFSTGCTKKYITEEENKKQIETLTALYKSKSWQTRINAIEKACQYSLTLTEALLITALDDIHPSVKMEALKCLGAKKSRKAKRIIRQIAESEENENVKMTAIQSLAKYSDPALAMVFVKGLSSKDWLIREESIKGLLMIDDTLMSWISIPYVVKALKDPRINVKLAALKNVKVKAKEIYNELSSIINNDKNLKRINLLSTSINAINGYLLDSHTRRTLISLLTHPSPEVRIASLAVLKTDQELLEEE